MAGQRTALHTQSVGGAAVETDQRQITHLGFNGELCEPLTGHYLLGNGYRAYNPILMRFNSPDSLSPFAEGGINAYTYCQGDPLNKLDPTGHIRIAKGVGKFFRKVSDRVQEGRVARSRQVAQVRPMIDQRPVSGPAASPRTLRDTTVAANAGQPRVIEQVDSGIGTSFSVYESGYLRELNDQQYIAAAHRNMGALDDYIQSHFPQIDQILHQTERMLEYQQTFIRGLPNRGLSPQAQAGNWDYIQWTQGGLDRIRRARDALNR